MDGAVRVTVETALGEFHVDVDTASAPMTAGNFLQYVDDGFYDGGRFFRTVTMENQPDNEVRIEVIQGGGRPVPSGENRETIPLERTSATGLSHVNGTISMARYTSDSDYSEFFICIGDQPELDFGGRRNPDGQGFAAFGKVVEGMDVVRRIQTSPHEAQTLTPPVRIVRIHRV